MKKQQKIIIGICLLALMLFPITLEKFFNREILSVGDSYLQIKIDGIYKTIDDGLKIEFGIVNNYDEYIEIAVNDFYINNTKIEFEDSTYPSKGTETWDLYISKELLGDNTLDSIESIKILFNVSSLLTSGNLNYDTGKIHIKKELIESAKTINEEIPVEEDTTSEDSEMLEEDDKLISEQEDNKEQETNIERENIIGTSNKKCSDIDIIGPSDVRNDTTGNWKLARVATKEDILEYILDYYENNFNDDEEIHAIVNFTLKTTTKVSKLFDNVLSITIHDYVDKEEHDAKKLFGGTVLGEYFIYLDNGDIEKIR